MIEIPANIRDEVVAHAMGHFPNESCGLLAGSPNGTAAVRAERFFPMTNADASPVSYRLDPKEQLLVFNELEEAGLELPFSCRAGVCSTCRTKVVRGAVEMAQNYALEDWELEQGYVLACQSRVKTPQLELDYDEK